MADNIPKLEDNRFEALYQKWKAAPAKKWKIGGSLLAAFLLLEIISLGFTFTWYHLREVNAYPFLDKFALTRTFVSPFLFDNPARAPKGIDYIGPRERRRSEPKWFVSDAMFGWRPAPNVSILKQPHGIKDPVGWKMTNTQGFPAAGSTEYFYENSADYKIVALPRNSLDHSKIRLAVDTQKDLDRFNWILNRLGEDYLKADYEKIIDLYKYYEGR